MSFTPNKNLEEPARGSNVGTWDLPVNSNTSILDNALGGVATIALTNSNVTLSPSQYQCVFITLTGAISANIQLTLPAVGSFYTVQNLTTNTSAFYVTMTTTAAGGEAIGLPPGTPTDIFTDGTNVRFRNLGTVNKYENWAVSSSPSWLAACTKPPYLNCDGTSFSSATYPQTTVFLGGTTLPDARGRGFFALNQGQSRITSSAGFGIDGNTLLAVGGSQTMQQGNVPNYNLTLASTSIAITMDTITNNLNGGGTVPGTYLSGSNATTTPSSRFAISGIVNSGGSGYNFLPPGFVGGLTFLRVA